MHMLKALFIKTEGKQFSVMTENATTICLQHSFHSKKAQAM